MSEFLFSSLYGWLGIGGVIILACIAVGIYFPPFRSLAAAVALGTLAAVGLYTKGSRDRARQDKARREEALKKLQAEYDRINKRPDTPTDVEKRLDKGNF
jgi:hypothetical protein